MIQKKMTKQISISGLQVSYNISPTRGKAKATLIFLHGWGGTKESWGANIAPLSDLFDCIALDFPGFGESEASNKPWGVFEYATFLHEFIETLKITKPVVVGKSFGGRVAIVYGSQWPEAVKKIILVSAAGIETKSFRLKIQIWLTNALKTMAGILPGVDKESLRKMFYKKVGLKEEGAYKREVKKIVTNQDLRKLLTKILAPTLIVWGDNDKVLPLKHANQLKTGIRNSKLKIINGGDHWVHEKQSDEFNQIVIEFV